MRHSCNVMFNFFSTCEGWLEINLWIISLSCTTWLLIRKYDLSVGLTVPRIIWIIMYMAHTLTVSCRTQCHPGDMSVDKLILGGTTKIQWKYADSFASSQTVNTGTYSTARVTGRVRGAGISDYVLPWNLGASLRHGVVVSASSCSYYVICFITRTYRVGQNRLILFRTHFSLQCGVRDSLHTEEERMSCHVMSCQKPVNWKQIGAVTHLHVSGITWPVRSPDLTVPDFFQWGYLKERVFRSRSHTQCRSWNGIFGMKLLHKCLAAGQSFWLFGQFYSLTVWDSVLQMKEQALLIFERKIFRRICGPKYEDGGMEK